MADAKSLKRQYKRDLRQAYSAGELTAEQVERLHALGFYPEKRASDNQVVVCYETGEEFPTVRAAAKRYHLSANTIYLSINRGYSAGGLHWYYKSNGRPDISTLKPMKTRKVVCEETGEVFDSITDAAETYGVGNISQIIKNGWALHGRFHFRYEDAACGVNAENREPAGKEGNANTARCVLS